MHFYVFKYNEEKRQIELGDTGKVVARKEHDHSNMFIPDVDHSIGAKLALHVLNGLNRVHDIRFGEGHSAAKMLMEVNFEQPKAQNLMHDKHTIVYNAYTDTIRVKETNNMLLARKDDQWTFNFDGGAPEALVQQAFLRFYKDPDLKTATPEKLLEGLTASPERKLEANGLGM